MDQLSANFHQKRFIHYENILFTSLATDEQVENIMPPLAVQA